MKNNTVDFYHLEADTLYEVRKTFTDFYGGEFARGERLTFAKRHFLPYEGGYTIVFKERSLYLQEDANREIIDNFDEYFARV